MIYLQRERDEFELTKQQFRIKCQEIRTMMAKVDAERGEVRDMNSPLHHRQPPQGMLALAKSKCSRLDRLLDISHPDIPQIVEECVDIANYAVFIAALYLMIMEEQNATSEHSTTTVGREVPTHGL